MFTVRLSIGDPLMSQCMEIASRDALGQDPSPEGPGKRKYQSGKRAPGRTSQEGLFRKDLSWKRSPYPDPPKTFLIPDPPSHSPDPNISTPPPLRRRNSDKGMWSVCLLLKGCLVTKVVIFYLSLSSKFFFIMIDLLKALVNGNPTTIEFPQCPYFLKVNCWLAIHTTLVFLIRKYEAQYSFRQT